jgi:membrane fusion protein, multidrug efflux system
MYLVDESVKDNWIAKFRQRWVFWLIGFSVLAIGAYLFLTRAGAARGTPAEASPVVPRQRVPVAVVAARRGDLNQYLTALGAVTPFNTVMIKARVVGNITKVYFKEGQMVKEGDPLFEIDRRPYQVQLVQYQGQMARDRANMVNAKITLERDQTLYTQGVLARQDLDNQQAVYNSDLGTLKNDQGQIESAELNLAYCHITSPITGRVGLLLITLGNYVQPTDTTGLAVVTQLQPISVVFSIPEDEIPQVAQNMQGGRQLPVQAWNRDFSKLVAAGSLLTFDNQIDQTSGTVKLKAQFANLDYALFPNQFVNAKLLVDTIHGATLIPTAALQKNSQGAFIYVVKEDSSVEKRPVTVGVTQGDTVSIDKGVTLGEMVVVDGLDKLQQGTKVSAQLAANAPVQGNNP